MALGFGSAKDEGRPHPHLQEELRQGHRGPEEGQGRRSREDAARGRPRPGQEGHARPWPSWFPSPTSTRARGSRPRPSPSSRRSRRSTPRRRDVEQKLASLIQEKQRVATVSLPTVSPAAAATARDRDRRDRDGAARPRDGNGSGARAELVPRLPGPRPGAHPRDRAPARPSPRRSGRCRVARRCPRLRGPWLRPRPCPRRRRPRPSRAARVRGRASRARCRRRARARSARARAFAGASPPSLLAPPGRTAAVSRGHRLLHRGGPAPRRARRRGPVRRAHRRGRDGRGGRDRGRAGPRRPHERHPLRGRAHGPRGLTSSTRLPPATAPRPPHRPSRGRAADRGEPALPALLGGRDGGGDRGA